MKSWRINTLVSALTLLMAFTFGCGRKEAPPPEPLPAAEMPAALEKAFANAKPELAEQVKQLLASLQAKDYPKSLVALQTLSSSPDLSQEQSMVLARSSLTVNSLLQEAQAQGDQKATQTLNYYQQTK